ncbi:MAG: Si-specific NAD(P)(+) transhydrogenase [Planctomycetes bacterium]|nr:Si-specific NAD(P)(+) transhydrogenase [Planctomycetota bacterium]
MASIAVTDYCRYCLLQLLITSVTVTGNFRSCLYRQTPPGGSRLEDRSYDLVVIGSGPAGEKGAAQAAYFGKKVALIERENVLGGAAANTGTLPSKTLRETALMLSGLKARGFGVDFVTKRKTTVREFLYKEERVKETERARVKANFERHKIDLVRGHASFTDPHKIRVVAEHAEPVILRGDVILIATGSAPLRPDIFKVASPRVYDSDTILGLREMPGSLIVVGGGVIGCEYACTFAAQGVKVTLVDGRDTLLGFLDREISLSLMDRMRRLGIELAAPERVSACQPGGDAVKILLESGKTLESDAVLVAAGRQSNTATLNLDLAGIAPGERGLIKVDAHYRTSVPHIYAAGDVIGFPALASTSMEQARLAVVNAFDLKYKTAVAPVLPYGIYTIPEVSMVGETEETLKAKGVDYVVGRASYAQNARGEIIGDMDGFLKLLFKRDDLKLLGVHVIGESASEIIHVGLTALMVGEGADLFIRTCYNYPTLGELYKYATYDAMGRKQRGEK